MNAQFFHRNYATNDFGKRLTASKNKRPNACARNRLLCKLSALLFGAASFLSVVPSFAQTTLEYDPALDYTVNENEILDMFEYQYLYKDSVYSENVITLNGGGLIAPNLSITYDVYDGTLHLIDCGDYQTPTSGSSQEPQSDFPFMRSVDQTRYSAYVKYQADMLFSLGGAIMSADDYRRILETGVDDTYGVGAYVHPRKIVVNSGEICVFSTYTRLGLDAQQTTGNFVKSGYGELSFGTPDWVYYDRDEKDNISFDKDGLARPQGYYTAANVFGGDFAVEGGTVNVNGTNTFNGDVTVGIGYDEYAEAFGVYSSLTVNGSETHFNGDVNVVSGTLNVGSYLDGNGITFEKDVTISGDELTISRFCVKGAAQFNGNVKLDNSYVDDVLTDCVHTSALFATNSSGGRAVFAEDSIMTVGFNTQVDGEAECLNVDLDMKGGYVAYSNVDEDLETFTNELFVTYDENDAPTYLEWEATRNCIEDPVNGALVCERVLNRDAGGYGVVLFTSIKQKTDELTTSANGYSVVIDGGDRSRYWGETLVNTASLILKGNTSYGVVAEAPINQFVVNGESYIPVSYDEARGRTTWEVASCGVLGFYRGDEADPTVAPTINADVIGLYDGCSYGRDDVVVGGARVWIDASPAGDDASQNRALGTLNANTIRLGEKTKIWYDRVSTMENGASGSFVLNAPKIEIVSTEYDETSGLVTHDVLREATSDDITALFGGAQLVNASYQTNDDGQGIVTIKALDAADYAKSNDMTQKERDYAAKLDANRTTFNADTPFYDALYNETDRQKVVQTIHNLSIGGYRMLNAYGHFGNPTSSFFGGSIISGEHKRAQDFDPDYDPITRKDESSTQESAIAKEKVVAARNNTLWGAYTNTFVEGDDYVDDGVTTDGYRLKRQGIVGGLNRQFDGSTSGGLFFGLSNPELASSGRIQGDYGNYGSRMEMDDFQFAAHYEKVFNDFWEFALYVGGGTQSMDWRRDLYLTEGGRYRFEADGAGNTLTGTAYLSNRINLSENAAFRPTIGIDSEHSWLYAFNETQTSGGSVDDVNTYMRWLAQSYAYDQTYYNRNTARVGGRFNWSNQTGYAGLNTQAFYAVKLGGKDSPLISYRSENYSFDNMESHIMGNESFSVGGGGFVKLNREKTLGLATDFNAVWYKNATTQNLTGSLSYQF